MREHWNNCIVHENDKVDDFIARYFTAEDRKCLILAGAGFDPRAQTIAAKLAGTLGDRLHGILVREERMEAAPQLRDAADANEAAMRGLIPGAEVHPIRIFDLVDKAPVGGQRIVDLLKRYPWPAGVTDVVLDMSALSTGIAFPAARFLLAYCEARPEMSFHLMIASNPELEARIVGEPHDTPSVVRGYAALPRETDLPVSRIWLPQLASGRQATLDRIQASLDSTYRICPMLPFPARNPRRADDLLTEFRPFLDDRTVDARDFLYVSERNPLDTFRKLSTLNRRHADSMRTVYEPELMLSPIGSKVMAIGAMMAAIEHQLPVHHVENVRYDYDDTAGADERPEDLTLHVWLDGPVYAGYPEPRGRS
ncbi:MAG: hypothetical protein EON59_01920 [Alphaproteobacteria bacterium]|nr:MAG: hypothetical protein EON59_01920 [Alphaproteobacteria bacterium]